MNHKLERNILITAWATGIFLLLRFIPREKAREAQVAFMFKQVITWLFGLIVVELNLIRYPYRLFFKKTNKASFSFEFFLYPALCSLFNVYYPERRSWVIKSLYYGLNSSFITLFEVIVLHFTQLIDYKKWTWYWTFITVWVTYYISHVYYRWFFKVDHPKHTSELPSTPNLESQALIPSVTKDPVYQPSH